jgi:hypothetical protein
MADTLTNARRMKDTLFVRGKSAGQNENGCDKSSAENENFGG